MRKPDKLEAWERKDLKMRKLEKVETWQSIGLKKRRFKQQSLE